MGIHFKNKSVFTTRAKENIKQNKTMLNNDF